MRRQDERRRGSLAKSSSAGIEALAAPFGQDGNEVSLLEGVGKEIRSALAKKRCIDAYRLFPVRNTVLSVLLHLSLHSLTSN